MKKYLNILKKSSIPEKKWVAIFLAEAIFVSLAFQLFKFYFSYLERLAEVLSQVNILSLHMNTPDATIQTSIEILQSTMQRLYFSVFVIILILVVLYIICNSYIWAKIAAIDFNKRYLKRYALTAFPVLGVSVLLYLGIFKVYQSQKIGTYFAVLSLIVLHVLTAMNIAITKSKSKHALKQTLEFAFEKFHKFIPPYVIGIILLVVFFNVAGYFISGLPKSTMVYVILAILYSVWWRIYIYNSAAK